MTRHDRDLLTELIILCFNLQIQGEASTMSQGAKPLYRGLVGTLSTIMRTEGVTSWYCGLTAGLQRQMCFASIRIGLYEPMKQFYTQNIFGTL